MSQFIGRRTAARLLEAVVWLKVLLLAALGLSVLMFTEELQYQRGMLAHRAAARADAATQRISDNPQHWQFEELRLQEILQRSVLDDDHNDRRTILDANGQLLIGTAGPDPAPLATPVIQSRAPLYDAGQVVGWLQVQRSIRPQAQRSAGLAALTSLLGALAIGFMRHLPLRALRRVEVELEHKALHDALTGLYNREAFRRMLDRAVVMAQHRRSGLAVLFIDLDRFKSNNDTLGHDAGDDALRGVARRLLASVRSGGVVARLSDDEFTIVLDGLDSAAQAGQVADALLARFSAPFDIAGRAWHLICSVGLSLYPQHAQAAGKLPLSTVFVMPTGGVTCVRVAEAALDRYMLKACVGSACATRLRQFAGVAAEVRHAGLLHGRNGRNGRHGRHGRHGRNGRHVACGQGAATRG